MSIPNLHTNPAAAVLRDSLEYENIKQAEAAREMQIPRSRLSDIFAGRKGVSADTALRFERYLGIPADLLVQLQADYDLSKAAHGKKCNLERITPAHTTEQKLSA